MKNILKQAIPLHLASMPHTSSVEDLISSTIASLHARLTRLEAATDIQANNMFNKLTELYNFLQKDNALISLISDKDAKLNSPVIEDNEVWMNVDTPHQMIYIECDSSTTIHKFVVKFQQGGRTKSAKYATKQEVAQALVPLLSLPAK